MKISPKNRLDLTHEQCEIVWNVIKSLPLLKRLHEERWTARRLCEHLRNSTGIPIRHTQLYIFDRYLNIPWNHNYGKDKAYPSLPYNLKERLTAARRVMGSHPGRRLWVPKELLALMQDGESPSHFKAAPPSDQLSSAGSEDQMRELRAMMSQLNDNVNLILEHLTQ